MEACLPVQPGRLRRQRLIQLPSGFPDGSSEKSAEEDTTQSHRGAVSTQRPTGWGEAVRWAGIQGPTLHDGGASNLYFSFVPWVSSISPIMSSPSP